MKNLIKRLDDILSEDTFDSDPNSARQGLEQEEIAAKTGAGTYTREAARKKLVRYCQKMAEIADDPEQDRNFQHHFTLFVSWADAVMEYDAEWERTKKVLKGIFND
jgi:hypothetical protein